MKKTLMLLGALSLAIAAPALANDNMSVQEKVDAKFAKYDTNKDGKLTKAELDVAKSEKFNEADANKDGVVTKAELTTWKTEKHSM